MFIDLNSSIPHNHFSKIVICKYAALVDNVTDANLDHLGLASVNIYLVLQLR